MHFGERLRQERLRRHLSQEALAEALGGLCQEYQSLGKRAGRPASFGSAAPLPLLWPASPGPICGHSATAPFHISLGRALPTQSLLYWARGAAAPDPSLCVGRPAGGTDLFLCSLWVRGIGKTHLALEYAYRHALEYGAVFWITAQSVESILTSFLTIAALLHLPERQEADQQRTIIAVQRWLSTHSRWLLIWDNLQEIEWLQRFQPPAPWGSVLITTQRQALGTLTQGLELPTQTQEEGILLLLRRAKVLSPQTTNEQIHQFAMSQPAEYAAAREVVRVMARLPLALDQAGAYLEETGCRLSDYLQLYERECAQLLTRRGTPAGDHPHSVASTFRLSSQRVEREHPAAAQVLRLGAFLSAEAIPEEIFVAAGFPHEAGQEAVAANSYQLDLTIAALRSFSLVQRHSQTRTFFMHRLVQAVIREEMSEQERARWQRRALRRLDALFPDEVTYEAWKQCERLLPHVLLCATTMADHAESQELLKVLGKAADYLRQRAQYEQAEALYQRALHTWEQTGGSEHPEVARTANGLAMLSFEQGKCEQAEPLHRRALALREEHLGQQHPETAESLADLARLYQKRGHDEQALSLLHRACSTFEQLLGQAHPETVKARSDYHALLKQRKRVLEALPDEQQEHEKRF